VVAPAGARVRHAGRFHGLFSEVQWTLGYVGLLAYIFAIVTYRIPIATPAILLSLLGVVMARARVRMPAFLVVFGAFILWGFVSYTQSEYPAESWQRLVLLSKLWLIAFATVNVLRTPAQVRFFLVFFLVCFATHPARGAIFNYFYGYNVAGRALWNNIFGNPNDLAALTLFPLSIAVALLKDPSMWIRRGAMVSVVVLVILVLMTQSRGAFLALALMALFFWRTQRHKVKALGGVVIVGLMAAFIAPSGVWDRVSALTSEGTEADSSSRQRWLIWEVAGQISEQNPVFGVGPGAYPQAHYAFTSQIPGYEFASGRRDAHSTYITLRAELGWPGLALFALMLAIPLLQAWRAGRRAGSSIHKGQVLAVAVALMGFLAAGVFGSFSQLSFLYLQLALLAVLGQMALGQQPLPATPRPALSVAGPGPGIRPRPPSGERGGLRGIPNSGAVGRLPGVSHGERGGLHGIPDTGTGGRVRGASDRGSDAGPSGPVR
jgi:putative inorganic carbon (hco3(-)) transporter